MGVDDRSMLSYRRLMLATASKQDTFATPVLATVVNARLNSAMMTTLHCWPDITPVTLHRLLSPPVTFLGCFLREIFVLFVVVILFQLVPKNIRDVCWWELVTIKGIRKTSNQGIRRIKVSYINGSLTSS